MRTKSKFDPIRVAGLVSSLLITGYSDDDARRLAIKMEKERAFIFRRKLINDKHLLKARFVPCAPARIEIRSDEESSTQSRSAEADSRLHQPSKGSGEKSMPPPTTTTSTYPISGATNPKPTTAVSDPMVILTKVDSDDEGERRRRARSQESDPNIVRLRSRSYVSDTAKR